MTADYFTYRFIDHLPEVPPQLIQDIYGVLDDSQINQKHRRYPTEYQNRMVKKAEREFRSNFTKRTDLHDQFKVWVKQNIAEQWTECAISITEAKVSVLQGPHTDWIRRYALFYVLEAGGDRCQTVFYRQHEHPVVRQDLGCVVLDYDQVQEIDRVCIPCKRWCLLNTQVLHGVENIERDRVAIHLGFWDDVFA